MCYISSRQATPLPPEPQQQGAVLQPNQQHFSGDSQVRDIESLMAERGNQPKLIVLTL